MKASGNISKYNLRASTMVEVMVMMILSGIIFMAVTDGWTIISRVMFQRNTRLSSTNVRYLSLVNLQNLVVRSDSISLLNDGYILFAEGAEMAEITANNKLLIVKSENHRDTLVYELTAMELQEDREGQKLRLTVGNGGHMIDLIFSPAKRFERDIMARALAQEHLLLPREAGEEEGS